MLAFELGFVKAASAARIGRAWSGFVNRLAGKGKYVSDPDRTYAQINNIRDKLSARPGQMSEFDSDVLDKMRNMVAGKISGLSLYGSPGEGGYYRGSRTLREGE